jgi:hypothetical protein
MVSVAGQALLMESDPSLSGTNLEVGRQASRNELRCACRRLQPEKVVDSSAEAVVIGYTFPNR